MDTVNLCDFIVGEHKGPDPEDGALPVDKKLQQGKIMKSGSFKTGVYMIAEETLVKDNDRLETLIKDRASEIGLENRIIYDGVAFPEKYIKSSPRVLWILKETYETNNCYGWHVSKIENKTPIISKKGTLRVVCRVSFAILNNCNYEIVCKAKNDDFLDSIQKIGWININKIAAGKRSPKDLTPQYEIWKDVLKQQIESYSPEVIICGNTLQYFEKEKYMDFRSDSGTKKSLGMGNCHYFCFPDRLFINAYHPSQLFLNEREYINKIYNAYNDWKINYQKMTFIP